LLEGKNVNLRVAEKEDIPLMTEWYNNLDVIGEYEFSPQISRAEREKNFDKAYSEPRPFEVKEFIIEKKDGTKVGTIGHYLTGSLLEIGYLVVPSERGKGYCTEATQLMVDYLFLSKDTVRIQAHTDVRNVASQKALEKTGFRKEGIIRKSRFAKGKWTDSFLYSILREEWKEPKILTKASRE
jgi:RimJ/RimL family protein N-acetyltransferase